MADETSAFLRASSRPRRQQKAALAAIVTSLALLCCACLLWKTSLVTQNAAVELEWKPMNPGSVHSVTPKIIPKVQHKSQAYGQPLSNMQHLFGIQHFPGHGLATSHPYLMAPSLKKAPRLQELTDGYMDAGAYLQTLESRAEQQQADHMKKWKANNLKAGKQMVKDAASLYKKWVMVDPYTGHSKPDLRIPDAPDAETAVASRSAARNQMLMQVTGADNGKTYTLPWFCIGVHPEADGSGQGWDGAVAPMGPHGQRGVDCTPPWLRASPAASQMLAEVPRRWAPVQRLADAGGEEAAGAAEPVGDMIAELGGQEAAAEEEAEAEAEAEAEEEAAAAAAAEGGEGEEAGPEGEGLGEEVFEVDQGDGDVMIKADTLMPWMFGLS